MALPPPPPKRNVKLAALSEMTVAPQRTIPVPACTTRAAGTLVPLNFKVDPAFKRRLKMYALEKDTTMVEVMMNTLNQLMDND